MSTVHSVHNSVGRAATEHPGLVKVGRAGWFAKGVVYVVAGILALLVASKASGWSKSPTGGQQEASPTGAIKAIAHSSGGPLLLILLAIGMLLYAAWRVVSAFLPGEKDAKSWGKRIGFIISAVIYTSFAITAFAFARSKSTGSTNGNSTVAKASGGIMQHNGGRVLIGVVGAVIIAVGLYRILKGFKMDVNDELDLGGVPAERRRWYERLGAGGEIGRGLGIGLIGYFLLRAAVTYDANQATGLDGAIRILVTKSGGLIVVLVVAVGFVAYGLFCLLTFTHRRLETP
jgi:hypothetical protein